MSERLERHFIGQPLTDSALASIRATFEDVLKMASLSWNAPVAEDIEITIESDVADQSKLNISMKPKPGLDDYRYFRVQRFMLGEKMFEHHYGSRTPEWVAWIQSQKAKED